MGTLYGEMLFTEQDDANGFIYCEIWHGDSYTETDRDTNNLNYTYRKDPWDCNEAYNRRFGSWNLTETMNYTGGVTYQVTQKPV
jgi:hypothetical protein